MTCDCCAEREAVVHGVDETGIHPVSLCDECKATLLGRAPPPTWLEEDSMGEHAFPHARSQAGRRT